MHRMWLNALHILEYQPDHIAHRRKRKAFYEDGDGLVDSSGYKMKKTNSEQTDDYDADTPDNWDGNDDDNEDYGHDDKAKSSKRVK